MGVWLPLTDRSTSYFFSLSDILGKLEKDQPGIFLDVSEGRMLIFSDYSGQHKGSSHEAYSFVVTTDVKIKSWLPALKRFREKWLPDNRRISFKNLNEPMRWRALPGFLATIGLLHGNLITFLIDRRVKNILLGDRSSAENLFPRSFPPNIPSGTVEKMLRLAGLSTLVLSGLRNESQ